MPGYAMRVGRFLKTKNALGITQNHSEYKMIDFVARISFDGAHKEKKLYLDCNRKVSQKHHLIKSYQDEEIQIKYSISGKNEFIKKTNDKRFFVLACTNKVDIANLKKSQKKRDIGMKSDPELLLDLYLEYGEDILKTLSFGFIFILIDYKNKTVKAYRDHIGIKNFCYYQLDTTIYLASSFKIYSN